LKKRAKEKTAGMHHEDPLEKNTAERAKPREERGPFRRSGSGKRRKKSDQKVGRGGRKLFLQGS